MIITSRAPSERPELELLYNNQKTFISDRLASKLAHLILKITQQVDSYYSESEKS